MTQSGSTEKYDNGHYIFDHVKPAGPAEKAGIKTGDTLVSINSMPIEEWINKLYIVKPGDTVVCGVLRNNQETGISIITGSSLSYAPWFFRSFYIIIILVSTGGLYILYKKPHDKASLLFFLYIQQFVVLSMGGYNTSPDPFIILTAIVFRFCNSMLGPTLINFHLIFPRPSRIFSRHKRLPMLFYITGFIVFILYYLINVFHLFNIQTNDSAIFIFGLIDLWWLTLTFLIALAIAIFQFLTIKDTLARNQLRIVVIGSVFGLITPMLFAIFYDYINDLWKLYPNLVQIPQGIGSIIMICCILIAIFRFRIWNIEVVIRKALLYLGATLVIILSYLLLLLYLVNLLTISETNVTRFIVLAVSVIIFLVLRDRLQKLIDRIFHRELYDSAKVVSEFEEKLAGIYRIDELKSKIVQCLDEIFHFKSFVFNLRKDGLIYEPAFAVGIDPEKISGEFNINPELENRLYKSKVFSPGELEHGPAFLEVVNGELIVPLVKDDQPYGFFVCGPKKSEKTYSMQDILVLSLIAKRIIALFHTASLYQKDLDRQLMLERERARISQDMHDDIGAGLTKIAMISEAKTGEQGTVSGERMLKVAGTARDMINRLNVIVWALNPRYDNLDSLVSYARRYFGEYLENFGIDFKMQVSGDIPDFPVTPDFRRNAFYAWQEAIHNAVKHGACSEINIQIDINDQAMHITIADNGKGFDHAKHGSGGNGLLNMKKRAEDLGGTIEIQSEAGKGTRIMFTFKL